MFLWHFKYERKKLKSTIFIGLTESKYFCCFKRWRWGNVWHGKSSKENIFGGTLKENGKSGYLLLSSFNHPFSSFQQNMCLLCFWSTVILQLNPPFAKVAHTETWVGSIPGLGKSPGGGHGNPCQYSCLEDPMDRGGWQATVHRVTKSQTCLKWLSTAHTVRLGLTH